MEGNKEVQLKAGTKFTFHNDTSRLGNSTQVCTTYKSLPYSVKPKDRILVGDGLIGFLVTECKPEFGEVLTIVENDGMLGETKSVNLPNIKVDLPAITKKDIVSL